MRPNGRPTAQHRFVGMDVLTLADGPIDEPMGRPDGMEFFHHLQALDVRRVRSERIALKQHIPHIGNQDRSPAGRTGE